MLYSAEVIAKKGKAIYASRFQTESEKSHIGKFVAIDVDSGRLFIGETPEEAIGNAQSEHVTNSYVIRVGHPAVYTHGRRG